MQYSRREYLDIVGIPGEVEADALEKKLVAIFEKLAFNIRLNAQSLSNFREERSASKFGISRET